MKECLNCHQSVTEAAKFCSHCGQKTRPGRLTLWEFFKIFFDTYFNLDSTVFRTIRDLFIPGRLTVKFFEGKRKSYFHPLRTFLLTAAFFIGMVGTLINGYLSEKADDMSKGIHEYFVKQQTLNEIDSMQQIVFANQPECFTNVIQDSLKSLYKIQILDSINQNIDFSISTKSGALENMKVEEMYGKSSEQLIEELELTSWEDKLGVRQMKRFIDDPNALIRTSIGNIIWMVILLMPVIALFLKLIYFRHGYFFVEHLVFSFHFNSFAFLLMGLIFWIWGGSMGPIFIGYLITIAFLFLAMKNYYRQSFFRTFLKWFLLLFGYWFSLMVFFGLMLMASFILF